MKFGATLCGLAVAGILATQANAAVVVNVNLQPEGGDTANHKFVAPGDQVIIDVHVRVTDDTQTAGSEGAQLLSGNYRSSNGGLLGDLSAAGDIISGTTVGVGVNGFNGSGSAAGKTQDADLDTDLDLGNLVGGSVGSGTVWAARNASGVVTGGPGTSDVIVGKIKFTVGSQSSGLTNIFYDISGGAFSGRANNAGFNITATTNFSSLQVTPAVLETVPEPASVGVLMLGAMGLLVRRRKAK